MKRLAIAHSEEAGSAVGADLDVGPGVRENWTPSDLAELPSWLTFAEPALCMRTN